jgi:hypothetical protein
MFIAYISSRTQPWPLLREEVAEVAFSDGFKFYVTSHDREAVYITATELKQVVEKAFLRSLNDVTSITHNHLVAPRMSAADFDQLTRLREFGWRGQYIIWCQGAAHVQ